MVSSPSWSKNLKGTLTYSCHILKQPSAWFSFSNHILITVDTNCLNRTSSSDNWPCFLMFSYTQISKIKTFRKIGSKLTRVSLLSALNNWYQIQLFVSHALLVPFWHVITVPSTLDVLYFQLYFWRKRNR